MSEDKEKKEKSKDVDWRTARASTLTLLEDTKTEKEFCIAMMDIAEGWFGVMKRGILRNIRERKDGS